MQLQFKIIIPLIDPNISKEDLSPEAGLIDVYSSDINRPWLDHHIFLLYEDKPTKESKHREVHFIHNSHIWTTKIVTICDKVYTLYTACIQSNELFKFYESYGHLTFGQRAFLFLFWDDPEVTDFAEFPVIKIPFQNKVVPEIKARDESWILEHESVGLSIDKLNA